MSFANPAALLLLLLIPYFIWLGRPRLAYRRRRDLTSLAVRILLVALLVFALAGVQVIRAADRLSVVFLVDASDSIDQNARQQADSYIRQSMATMGQNDRAGIVVFGANALIERPLSSAKEFTGITSTPKRQATNIAEAIRLGLAMFPADTARRIVILSDGLETVGNAVQASELAAATGVQVDFVPLLHQRGPEVLVTDVRAPTRVNAAEQFDLGVTVRSETATPARLTVLAGGKTVAQEAVDLKAGTNNFVFTLSVGETGFSDFQVRVDPASADGFYQNNALSGFSEVTGPPRVLIVSSTPDEAAALVSALGSAGLTVDVTTPERLPDNIAGIAGYKSVILANVSATRLSNSRMRVLQTYVRDLGGGLVAIGGPNSFGAGGYYQTPLEETLPVEMRIKDPRRVPKLTMAYVIDRSGSMEAVGPSGVTNLELAKEATRRSINFLFPQDRAGVLSFDSSPEWLVPIQYVVDQNAVQTQVGTLRPGGGTDINAALKEIAKALPGDPSTLKHVILLTDGGADPLDSVEIARRLHADYGITITSIGIGEGVPTFMQDIATVSGGIYYNLVTAESIPQVFAAETVLATRSYIVENPFSAAQTANTPILNGISALPDLLGYVATTAKDTATVALTAPGYDDPILASWQYGLGRAVAFTSDATARWGKNWTTWSQFSRFWSQVVRSTIVEGANSRLESRVEMRNGREVLVVEARDDQGSYLNGLNLQAAVVDPRLGAQTVKLEQVAPGRYETTFDPTQEGAYFIRVGGGGAAAGTAVGQTLGWVMSYSPEYQVRDTNTDLLNAVGNLTGGTAIGERPELAFSHTLRAQAAATPLWPLLLFLAVLLLPFDIAIRRLIITRSDLQKARAWAAQYLPTGRQAVPAASASGRITQLMSAKERAKTNAPTLPIAPAPIITRPVEASLTGPEPTKPITPSPTTNQGADSAGLPGSGGASLPKRGADNTLASRLLERKRNQGK
jgi:uncharacterized membrane protein